MKEIREERTRTEYVTFFVANDGERFTSREECEKYEKTARCVLFSKYNALVVGETEEEPLTGFGSDENLVQIVVPKSEKDIDLILQVFAFLNGDGEWAKSRIEKYRETLANAVGEKIIVGRGCDDDCFWVLGTERDYLSRISQRIADACEKKS